MTKIFAAIFVIMLAVGCASSLTGPQSADKQKKEVKKSPKPGDQETGGNPVANVKRPD